MRLDSANADRCASGAGESIASLAAFLASPAGRYVLDWEQAHFDAQVANIFGYHALQLGMPEIDALRENRMPLRLCASDRFPSPGFGHDPAIEAPAPGSAAVVQVRPRVAVINDFGELPFASQSIDLVVMPHILEFAPEPHQVLREVDRVLVAEGHVIISGFNPTSLWGLRHAAGRLGAAPFLPAEGQLISLSRIKDWLKLLSFEASRGRFGCYAPWARSERWLGRWAFMERAGDRWWPVFGSVYFVEAVKRVRGMRLIGPTWKRREERRSALAAVAPRTSTIGANVRRLHGIPSERAANDPTPPAAAR
ncbi:MAG TPA: methyltransferase domain-containing protein [Burkholderiaceae bacterium]|nr:methyltransferase domain-containing protein [Burkholderiaceae bacterium]